MALPYKTKMTEDRRQETGDGRQESEVRTIFGLRSSDFCLQTD